MSSSTPARPARVEGVDAVADAPQRSAGAAALNGAPVKSEVPEHVRRQLHDRASAVTGAASSRATADGALLMKTRYGSVSISSLEHQVDDNGVSCVSVRLAEPGSSGDPHYRVFNPPQLVEDVRGDVVMNGRRYRVDPLHALAEVVALHGGAVKSARRQ